MNRQVAIRYQFYGVFSSEEENIPFDLRDWINKIVDEDLRSRIKEHGGIKGRLEEAILTNEEYYALNFMRMDEVSNTYILSPDTEAQHVDLQENEYIAKNTVVLYDPRYNVLMVQCNRGSYGVAGIESYINTFYEEPMCFLRPIKFDFNNKLNNSTQFLKLDVRFANINEIHPSNKAFERLIQPARELNAVTAHVEIGLGYNSKKEKELNPDTVHSIITGVRDKYNREHISSAKITINDDRKSLIFDLLDNILSTHISYTVPPRAELPFDFMAERMVSEYDPRYRAVISNLNIR